MATIRAATAPRCQWYLTEHAIERYRLRIRPALTFAQAKRELEARANEARFVEMYRSGVELWRLVGKHRADLVVNPDVFLGPDELPTVVTVVEVRGRQRRRGSEPRTHRAVRVARRRRIAELAAAGEG